MHIVRTLLLLASCPLALGCSQTADLLTPDAGADASAHAGTDAATPDASDAEDAGSDAGPPPPTYGTLCTEDADCEALCDGHGADCVPLCDQDGRCGTACGLSSLCPGDAAACIHSDGESVCAAPCDPADLDPCEAWGMGCAFNPNGPSMCVPGCTENADCSDGRLCQRSWLGGRCFRPLARVGDGCEMSTDHQSDCNDRSFCIAASEDETEGICVSESYEVDIGFICRQVDAVHTRLLLSHGVEVDLCVPACDVDGDCAPGFVCQDALDGGRGCVPPVSA